MKPEAGTETHIFPRFILIPSPRHVLFDLPGRLRDEPAVLLRRPMTEYYISDTSTHRNLQVGDSLITGRRAGGCEGYQRDYGSSEFLQNSGQRGRYKMLEILYQTHLRRYTLCQMSCRGGTRTSNIIKQGLIAWNLFAIPSLGSNSASI